MPKIRKTGITTQLVDSKGLQVFALVSEHVPLLTRLSSGMVSNLHQRAAEIMVREGKTLRQALSDLGDDTITTQEAAGIERQKPFQQVLWSARHKYHQELAGDPAFGKQSLVGQGMLAIQKLTEAGEYDKALEGILKLAKIMGLVGADTTTNVVMNLSQKDLNELRARMAEQAKRK